MSWISGGMVLWVVVLTACGGAVEPTPDPEAPEGVAGGTPSAAPEPAATPMASAAPTAGETPSNDPSGFPCDVQAFFQRYCASCHTGSYPEGYYYVPTFKTREDLLRAERFGGTLGDAVVMRLTGAYSPMPPATAPLRPGSDEVAIVTRWVDDGMPSGPCGSISPSTPAR
jgi:hypothetical protein